MALKLKKGKKKKQAEKNLNNRKHKSKKQYKKEKEKGGEKCRKIKKKKTWQKTSKKIIHNNAELVLRARTEVGGQREWGHWVAVAVAVVEWHDKMATSKAEVRANDKMLLAPKTLTKAASSQQPGRIGTQLSRKLIPTAFNENMQAAHGLAQQKVNWPLALNRQDSIENLKNFRIECSLRRQRQRQGLS